MEIKTSDFIRLDKSQNGLMTITDIEKLPSNRTLVEICPVCQSSERSIQSDRFLISDSPEGEPYRLRVAKCTDCTHVYQTQLWSENQLRQYYENDTAYYRDDYVDIPRSSLLRFNSVLKDLESYLDPDWLHLDVGGYSGHFSQFISPHLRESHCLDVSNKLELGSESHVKIINETLFDFAASSRETYDFISLNHTLEHLSDLQKVKIAIKALLKPSGYILIEVPDDLAPTDSIIDYTLDHTQYFTGDSLLRFFDKDFDIKVLRHFQYGVNADVGNGYVYRVIAQKKQEKERDLSEIKKRNAARTIKMIEQRITGARDLFVWGSGYHTRLLFSLSESIRNKTKRLIDSDKTRAGRIVFGKKIVHPGELSYQDDAMVIISSFDYRDKIEEEARKLFPADHIINPYLT